MFNFKALAASALITASSVVAPLAASQKAEAYIPYTRVCLNAEVYAPPSNVRQSPSMDAPVMFTITRVRSLVVADAPYMGAWYKILNDEYRGGYIHMSQVNVYNCITLL